MNHLSQDEAFKLNSYVESFLDEEETIVISNIITDELLNDINNFLKQTPNIKAYEQFFIENSRLDNLRKQNYEKTFKEWFEILKR